MEDCIFCRIVRGDVPATVVHRDNDVLAIEDRNPQAPVHLLVIPTAHYATIDDMPAQGEQTARLTRVAAMLGRTHGGTSGFRLVVNTGNHGGQTVDHVHIHVLAGRPMAWPPG